MLKKLEYCIWELTFKNMVESETVRSKINLSSLIQCFTTIAGSIREKTKMDITRPPPLELKKITIRKKKVYKKIPNINNNHSFSHPPMHILQLKSPKVTLECPFFNYFFYLEVKKTAYV